MVREIANSDPTTAAYNSINSELPQYRQSSLGISETQSALDMSDCASSTWGVFYDYLIQPIVNLGKLIGRLFGCSCGSTQPNGNETEFDDDDEIDETGRTGDTERDRGSDRADDDRRTNDADEAGEASRRNADAGRSFSSLRFRQVDKENIGFILEHVAGDNLMTLGWNRGVLEERGAALRPVHPFRYIHCVFSDDRFYGLYETIKGRNGNIPGYGTISEYYRNGVKGTLTTYQGRNKLLPYVDSFSEVMRADPLIIRGFVFSQNWDGLLDHLERIRAGSIPPFVPRGDEHREEDRRTDDVGHREGDRRADDVDRGDDRRTDDVDHADELENDDDEDPIDLNAPLENAQELDFRRLFRTIATSNEAALLVRMNSLRNLWADLGAHASPHRILGFIFEDAELKPHFKNVLLSSVKRGEFLRDLKRTVEASAERCGIAPDSEEMWHDLGVQRPANNISWEAAIQLLIRTKILPKEESLNLIFTTVADRNVAELGFQYSAQLVYLWHMLRHEPPLEVLNHVFKDDTCKEKLQTILRSSLKRGPFLTDFNNTLAAGAQNHPVTREAVRAFNTEFALGTEEEDLNTNIDWRNLINVLVQAEIEDDSASTRSSGSIGSRIGRFFGFGRNRESS